MIMVDDDRVPMLPGEKPEVFQVAVRSAVDRFQQVH